MIFKAMFRRSALAVLACFLAVPSLSQGEIRPSDVMRPTNEFGLGPGYGKRVLQFHLDLHSFYGSQDVSGGTLSRMTFAPRLKLIQPMGHNEVEVILSTIRHAESSDVSGDEGDRSTFRIGNPSLTYFFTWRSLARQMRFGVGATAPVARLRTNHDYEQAIDFLALQTATALYGYQDAWLWAPDSMSTILHFDYQTRQSSGFIFGTRVVVAPSFRVSDSFNFDDSQNIVEPDDIALYGQAEFEFAYDSKAVRSALKIGYAINALSDLDRDQKDQIVVEPEFRVRLRNMDLLLGMTLNVDEPAGFSFDDGRIWAFRLGVSTPTRLYLPEK